MTTGIELTTRTYSLALKNRDGLGNAVEQTYARNAVETIRIFLYLQEPYLWPITDDRRAKYDSKSLRLTISDTPENLDRIGEFVESLPLASGDPPPPGGAKEDFFEKMVVRLSLDRGQSIDSSIGVQVRLIQVESADARSGQHASAEIQIDMGKGVQTVRLQELETSIVEDLRFKPSEMAYLLTADAIQPSGQSGDGHVELTICLLGKALLTAQINGHPSVAELLKARKAEVYGDSADPKPSLAEIFLASNAPTAPRSMAMDEFLDQHVSIATPREVSLDEFMRSLTLAVVAPFKFSITDGARAIVFGTFKDLPLRKVLDTVLEPAGLNWTIDDANVIAITLKLKTKTFRLTPEQKNHIRSLIDSGDLKKSVWGQTDPPSKGISITLDELQNLLIVTGTDLHLQRVDALIQALAETTASDFVTQFYKIRETDGERIRALINSFIQSDRDSVFDSERKIYIDGDDLIVRDTADNIKKIEALLIDRGFVTGPRDTYIDIRSYSLAPRNIETIKSDVVKNFTSHVVETIRTFLYPQGGEGDAAKQGRRWWFNEDSFLLTVIDTPGNLDQIDKYLNTLPQLPRNAGKTLDAAPTVALNRGEARPVFNTIIRLIRVVPHESPDHRSDSAQIQINVGNQVQTATLQEGQTQTVGDYMIAADDIQPSGLDESGEGRVQLTIQDAPLVRLISNISDGPSLKPQPPADRPSSLPKAPAAAAATTHTSMRSPATPLATAHYRIRKTDTDRVRSLIYSVVGSRTAADDASRSTIKIDGEYLTVRDTPEHLSSIEKLVNQQGLARNLRDDGLELESFSLVPKEVATLDDAVVKTFASQVVEAVGVFLYAKSGGSQAAEAEGRRLWFDADSMQMSIVDRPENLKRVAGYVDSLPQIEKKRQQRVVRLNHALAADLAASLERSLDIHADPVAGAANVPVPPITINPVKELNALVIRYTDETKYQDAMDLIKQLDQPVAVIRVKTTIAVFSREAGERLRLSASPPPEGWNVYFKAMATGAEKGALKDMHPAPNGVSVFQGPETAATSGTRAGFHLATRGANPALDESLDLHLTPEMTGDRSIVLRDVAFEWNAIEATRLETASIKLAAGGSAILASPGINRAGERVFVALSAEPADPAEPRPPAPPQAPLPPQ